MDYIEHNIDADFSLDQLAKQAGFSKYHFHRLFHSLTGESLFAFIQRIRVEKAAGLLLTNKARTITDIALDCGFSSSAAFSRSFRNRFLMSATQWRKSKGDSHDIESGLTQAPQENDRILVKPESVAIQTLEDITVAYIRYTGPYKGDAKLFQDLYATLLKWAVPRDLVDPKYPQSLILYHDSIEITQSEKLRLSVCIEVPEKTKVSGEIGKMKRVGGKYACVRFRLGPADYAHAWHHVFCRWLPTSGYQPDDRTSFEFYPAQSIEDSPDGKTDVDICVPIKPF
jgi:AraC family transcriptional regulator